MQKSLAFDVYGTLIDPLGISTDLADCVGEAAPSFASAWREKQLEYLFRRGLSRKYEPFSVCTRQALDYTCGALGFDIGEEARAALMNRYLELPAFAETGSALRELKDKGVHCYAFSNGEPDDLARLLANAGLDDYLRGIVSVHETQSFKPDPSVYAYFLENTGAMLGATWLVSGNPFDVIGAMQVGWKAAWVRRNAGQLFDPWGIEPTIVVPDLDALVRALD